MNKADLALLERAFTAEINAAIMGWPRVMQTKSKRAVALADDGYLAEDTEQFHGATIKGYVLTHAGRLTYGMSCPDEAEAGSPSGT